MLDEIEIAGNSHNGLILAQDLFEHGHHTLFQQTLLALLKFQMIGAQFGHGGFIVETGQHLAVLVHDGDLAGLQPRYA